MKNLFLFIIAIAFLSNCNNSKSIDSKVAEKAGSYLKIAKSVCDSDNGKLLGFTLHAPILIYDTLSKTVYTNEANKDLQAYNDLFAGAFPDDIDIKDNSLVWNNKKLNKENNTI